MMPDANSSDVSSLANIRGVILDLDGVVYRGDQPVPGAAALIAFLKDTGRRVICLTNNAEHGSAEIATRLQGMGIGLTQDDIITSGWATGAYLRTKSAAPRVHILGSPALRETVLSQGAVEASDPEYVVVGIYGQIRVAEMATAAAIIANGAQFIATNPDLTRPGPDCLEPECGSLIAFLEAASGHRAITVGKPNPAMFDAALTRLDLSRDEVLMIGDTLETDIAGAHASGLRSVLLGNGTVTTTLGGAKPTIIAQDLDTIRQGLADAEPHR